YLSVAGRARLLSPPSVTSRGQFVRSRQGRLLGGKIGCAAADADNVVARASPPVGNPPRGGAAVEQRPAHPAKPVRLRVLCTARLAQHKDTPGDGIGRPARVSGCLGWMQSGADGK